MLVYCLDCDHWFVEHPVDTAVDLMVCPFCDGGNWEAYDEDGDPDAGVDSFKEGHEDGR